MKIVLLLSAIEIVCALGSEGRCPDRSLVDRRGFTVLRCKMETES